MLTKTKSADLTLIGARVAGGFVRGHFLFDMKPYALVSAPIAVGLIDRQQWNDSYERVRAAESWNDGAANTAAMVKAGSAVAKRIAEIEIDGERGWHIPSRLEALTLFYSRHGAKIFAKGGAEHVTGILWTSTQYESVPACAWAQNFGHGGQYTWHSDHEFRVLPVRRLAI